MGFSLSWLAVKGKARDEILRELALVPNGVRYEFAEPPCVGAEMPGGWYLVVKDHDVFADGAELTRLSAEGELVTCYVEEHVMVSEAAGWRNGKKVWWVTHDSQKKQNHLEARGELPAEFPAIRDRLQAKQAEEEDPVDHIFDIPVELAVALVGYRYDRHLQGMGEEFYEALRPDPGARQRSWWRKWFGKSTA